MTSLAAPFSVLFTIFNITLKVIGIIVMIVWVYSWFLEPIVIVVNNPFGAFDFGPLIFISPTLYYSEDIGYRDYVLNHEYNHFLQFKRFGPVFVCIYPFYALFSLIKDGNIWTSNYWELQADENARRPLDWTPIFVWVW